MRTSGDNGSRLVIGAAAALFGAGAACMGPAGAYLRDETARAAPRTDRSANESSRVERKLEVLHVFQPQDGKSCAGLMAGADGDVYGTTNMGGSYGQGTIYHLSAGGLLTVLHDFGQPPRPAEPGRVYPFGIGAPPMGGPAALVPHVTSLVDGGDGNVYGAESTGGPGDDGMLFKIDPLGNFATADAMTFRVRLARWRVVNPTSLVRAPDGTFYGTAHHRVPMAVIEVGKRGGLFKVDFGGDHHVLNAALNISLPLTIADDGTIYGISFDETPTPGSEWITQYHVFKLSPLGDGTVLYNFPEPNAPDGHFGATPNGPLTIGADGNLYGTTTQGGAYGRGAIFKLSSTGDYTLLYSFSGKDDGAAPAGPLLPTNDGGFYGVATGSPGSVFKVSPDGHLTILHAFDVRELVSPAPALALGPDGRLYGIARHGSGNFLGGVSLGEEDLFALNP
jgi:uncharacterized repeat protein (TIGR03803 family)